VAEAGAGRGAPQSTWLFALIALLSITAGTLYQKRFVAPCDVRTANLVQLAAAFVVTLPLALMEPSPCAGPGRWRLNGELAGAMAWSVLGLTLGGSSLLYLLIQRGAATAVTSLMYLVPPTHRADGVGAVRRADHAADRGRGAWRSPPWA
jgi:drug/metabolite transporter (DMT)-like permease